MVSLQEFVKESLAQISKGVMEANTELEGLHVQFAPYGFSEQGKSLDVIDVEFDILLSAVEDTASSETMQGGAGFNSTFAACDLES